jgi:hypothetical protein
MYPLTHFEELMFHQDSPAYPATCFLRLRFHGRLDRSAFEAAARIIVSRHPLLRATIRKNSGRYRWRVGDVETDITWVEGDQSPNPAIDHIDLNRRHGLRLIVNRHAQRSEVLIQFHHACCDGCAIYQVVRELLIAYTSELPGGPALNLPPSDKELLRNRESSGFRFGQILKIIFQQTVRLPSVWNFFRRTPLPVVPHERASCDGPVPQAYPQIFAHHFDYETSASIRGSLPSGGTVNDLLTRDLFLAMSDFRRQQRYQCVGSWLRLMIPVNLRRKSQYRVPAANIIGSVFLDRCAADMSDPDALLRGVRREMNLIKRLQLGYLFVYSLVIQRWLPGGLRLAARPKRNPVSAVFTNLGRVLGRSPLPRVDGRLQCGNVVLEHTEPAPPIARSMCAAFSASWYANRLSVTLHHDPRPISRRAGAELLNLFVRRIRMSAGCHCPRDEGALSEHTAAFEAVGDNSAAQSTSDRLPNAA